MQLSDLSVRRPVLAAVVAILERVLCFGVLSRAHGPPRGKARAAGKAVRLGKARHAASRWPVRAGRFCKVPGTLYTCSAVSPPPVSSHAPHHATIPLRLRSLPLTAGFLLPAIALIECEPCLPHT